MFVFRPVEHPLSPGGAVGSRRPSSPDRFAPVRRFFGDRGVTAVMTTATAGPPNRAAHALAWWISQGRSQSERFGRLQRRAAVSVEQIWRMFRGEVVPADDVAAAIARATSGAVRPEDWDRPAGADWTDRPQRAARH